MNGMVYLVGAGPGDYRLITLKGKECLEKADVVICDYLADKRLLAFAPENVEYIYVGKKAGNHAMRQEDISQLIADKAKEGNPYWKGDLKATFENNIIKINGTLTEVK